MKKYVKKGWQIFLDCQHFFYVGFKKNLFKEHLRAFFLIAFYHLNKFHVHLLSLATNKQEQLTALQKQVKGLHSLLPFPSNYTYSILIELKNTSSQHLQSCLSSACMQTAPNFEILIGSKIVLSNTIFKIIKDIEIQYSVSIKLFDFSQQDTNDYVYNLLAKEATGNYLFFLEQEDWIRPDLFYRYEQFLRILSDPDQTIINCFEDRINKNDHFIPHSTIEKKTLTFPYIFESLVDLKGMLIPKTLWLKIGGLQKIFSGAEIEDLILSLDVAGATFTTIPICLYSVRAHKISHKASDFSIFIHALRKYSQAKALNWEFYPSYRINTVRVTPKDFKIHKIQIIIPFREQKEMTLRCVNSIMKQKNTNYQITAIDNGSADHSISNEIQKLGGEVLRIEEPFNYSRLNNLAVSCSKMAQDCDLILFLNNDVELDDDALHQMSQWIDQPLVGIVGARLHYPDGRLQHGGLLLNNYFFPEKPLWRQREKFKFFEEMEDTKIEGVVDAVTAACALIKKDTFLKIGGFDDIWYPIAYSDTSLAIKLNQIGLKSFYTPYAFGVHHESLSRKEMLEDVESSRWLHELINSPYAKSSDKGTDLLNLKN